MKVETKRWVKIEINRMLHMDRIYYYVKDDVFKSINFEERFHMGGINAKQILFKESDCIAGNLHNGEWKDVYHGRLVRHVWYDNNHEWEEKEYAVTGYRIKQSMSQIDTHSEWKLHNEVGPARMVYNRADEVTEESYYLHGKLLSESEWEAEIATKLYW